MRLRVEIDPRSGFCPGVQRAVEMAESVLDERGTLYCLGDMVHNDAELDRLKDRGMVSVGHERLKELRGNTILFRAHGEPPASYRLASENGLQVIDATCPVVRRLQRQVKKAYENGEHVMICGKPGHPEVVGLAGQAAGRASVVNDPENIVPGTLPPQVTLFCQTTLPVASLRRLEAFLKGAGIQTRVHNTICSCVSGRHADLRNFASKVDALVFVGGRTSSNARALYEICKQVNPRTYFAGYASEIESDWFRPATLVGVTGAASTPDWMLKKAADVIRAL